MTSWANQFDDLKNQFVARSRERLVAIEALLARLQAAPANVSLLGQTMQHFHWLAGSGGTYGFDDITSWGTYGEELCDYLLKLGGPVSGADHEKLTTALRTVEQLFAAYTPAQTRVIDQSATQTKLRHPDMSGSGSMNTGVETYNKSGGNNPPYSSSGGYTPPPTMSQSSSSSAGSGSFGGPPGSKAGPSGAGGTSSASHPGAQTQSNPNPYAGHPGAQTQSNPNPYAGHPGAQTQSNPNPYASQTETNPRGQGIAGYPNSAAGVQPKDSKTTVKLSAQSLPGQMPEATRILSAPPPGTGGFFHDTMKTAPAPAIEARRASRLAHIPIDRKFAIFADSNVGNLAPVKAALEERGIMVEGVATASEAKGLFSERLPDIFIVGAPLIDNNGYELVEYLRGLEAGHKPIVIVLAQQAAFLDKVYAIRSGADAFFEYPSELNDLLDKINALIDRDKNENYKILSVEDDPDMANFIKLTLQSAGYTVLHISDAKTFEEHFLSFEPDLVMLDVLLGEMTGFEIAKYIRQNDRFATLPIVFLTTQNKLHQHIRSAIAGGDEHLIKPVAPQLLIATVASRLERARSLKRLIDRDGLTRCLNFGSFMERAQKLAVPDGYRSAPAMMMIDVDNMKKINEKMGFAAGDRIISNIANMLLKGFRNTDLIARFGNDQFAIVLEHLNPQQLQSLSSQVLGAISGTPQLVKGRSVSVTCSGGVAILEQGMTVQSWLDAAQDSLRKAKDAGGNRAIVRPSTRRA
jgi:diguanylate cyclase (GGDEF)-like protein